LPAEPYLADFPEKKTTKTNSFIYTADNQLSELKEIIKEQMQGECNRITTRLLLSVKSESKMDELG